MIRGILLGRTGNQIFEYAAARSLAARTGGEVAVDGSGFGRKAWNQRGHLRDLGLRGGVSRRFPGIGKLAMKFADRHPWEWSGRPVWREHPSDLSFDPSVFEMPGDCVIRGYFQSWRYFEGIEDSIREELDLAAINHRKEVRELSSRLGEEEVAAVHVRRTDYVNNPNVGFLDERYYRRAVDRLRDEGSVKRFLVFTDDRAACEGWLQVDGIEWCDERDPWSALHLMASCRHHIIANSSFSWWGAWLGKKEGQRVLMPSEWSRGDMISPIEDKRCPGWEMVDVE